MTTTTKPNAITAAEDMIRQFNAGLQRVKFELEKGLMELNPLDYARLANFVAVFNERLVVFQHEFLDHIAQIRGGAKDSTIHVRVRACRSVHRVFGWLGGLGVGCLASWLARNLPVIPVGIGHLWWKKTVYLPIATWLAAKLGISIAVAAAGIGVVAGIVAGLLIARAVAHAEQRRVRRTVKAVLNREVVPKLQAWAKECIGE